MSKWRESAAHGPKRLAVAQGCTPAAAEHDAELRAGLGSPMRSKFRRGTTLVLRESDKKQQQVRQTCGRDSVMWSTNTVRSRSKRLVYKRISLANRCLQPAEATLFTLDVNQLFLKTGTHCNRALFQGILR